MQVELAHQVQPVCLHGLNGQGQDAGDLFVRVAFSDQLQHFPFALEQFSNLHRPDGLWIIHLEKFPDGRRERN